MPEITKEELSAALETAIRQTRSCLPEFAGQFKHIFSNNNFYSAAPNDQWTNGFWTGELWLAYENTKDELFCDAAMIQVKSFLDGSSRESRPTPMIWASSTLLPVWLPTS